MTPDKNQNASNTKSESKETHNPKGIRPRENSHNGNQPYLTFHRNIFLPVVVIVFS